MTSVKLTLIGGPTALIEIGGFRLLTEPTFDSPGEYKLPYVTRNDAPNQAAWFCAIASAIATVRRAISACSRSTMRPSIWMTPLLAFSG
jgi:hypothetical protein